MDALKADAELADIQVIMISVVVAGPDPQADAGYAVSKHVWGIELNFGKFAPGNLINLRRQKPPYLINITIGDPDSAHDMFV